MTARKREDCTRASRCLLNPETMAYLKRTAQSVFLADVPFGSMTIVSNVRIPKDKAVLADDNGNVVVIYDLAARDKESK